ncbi:aldehyde dehydrogenase [Emcibacter nanhaiensis]|uniref:Aldehyde dehydrogenase n=1 Tax=Emcibacter nanhaiensis TaxID=1505037 RepID=A0A501PF55_9PROT|nr:aldehyde dehydrogenase [Emcibacter nanhaiensis]TPD59079.1 aldehyde dehydrogenase [Emcibacter nanhaiensis]
MDAQLLINAQFVPAADGRTYERCNPVTGEVASRAPAAGSADIKAAVEAAQAALPEWSGLGPNARRAALMKASQAILDLGDEFVEAMKGEIGATEGWARFNVMLASQMFMEAAALTTQVQGQIIPSDKPGCMAMAVRKPAGVILGIAPWNAPVILGVRAVATPLACGNTAILKASEVCPVTHMLIGKALNSAGLPAGAVNVITNAPEDAGEVVGELIDHKYVRRVNFTGSSHVGRIIAERAARTFTPVLLELGGKAPLVVLEDADLDEAVKAIAFGAYMNQGQICMSTERVVVEDSVADALVEKLTAKAATLVAGDPREGNTPLGALVDRKSVDHVLGLVNDAGGKGADVTVGGTADGVQMSATVVDKVTKDMRIYTEESFGPVVAVIRVRDAEEAVTVANDSEYGLSAAVFSKDIVKALKIAERIDSGICHINGATVHDEAQMPFGGTKSSGYGRFGGQAGINEFTDLRWITLETEPGHFPI